MAVNLRGVQKVHGRIWIPDCAIKIKINESVLGRGENIEH